jgi:hypothetical protein
VTSWRPEPALRDLHRFERGLRVWRAFTTGYAVFVLLGCTCGLIGAGRAANLAGPVIYLGFTLTGTVLLVVSLSRAIAAIDAMAGTVRPPGLTSARSMSLAAGGVLVAGQIVTPAFLIALRLPGSVFFLVSLLFLLVLSIAPIAFAFLNARYYGQLIRWHRPAPPDQLRPPPLGGWL